MPSPLFLYDTNSPYAYLAAHRVDAVLPVRAQWRPIALGVLLREARRLPWSMTAEREAGQAEVARRAAARGLPQVRYPEGWPRETYSVVPLRALMACAEQADRRRVTLALFEAMFVRGESQADPEVLRSAIARAGLDVETVLEAAESEPVRTALRQSTTAALEAGVPGVPAVVIEDRVFWGDDQLDAVARAAAGG